MLADLIAQDIAVRLVAVIADLSPLGLRCFPLDLRHQRIGQRRVEQAVE